MWQVDFTFIEGWLNTLDEGSVKAVFASVELLERQGPSLGRPLVDIITGSRVKNMKELRPASPSGSELRILFVFDPTRKAIMLVGGDKASGKSRRRKWFGWYKKAIPEAERLYRKHLKGLDD